MKSIAATTLFVSLALAKSALIPAGISTTCSDYLAKLDGDTSLSGCTTSIISATSAFAPSLNGSSSATPSAADAKSALTSVCANTACSSSTIRSALADFYQSCSDELTSSGNKDVIALYDTFYVLPALRTAMCTKDDSGEFCPITVGKTVNLPSGLAKDLSTTVPASSGSVSRRADTQVVASIKVNPTTLVNNNLLFMGLSSSLTADQCTTCTRNILTSYIAFEATTPYAPGLTKSVYLIQQTPFYQAVVATCGDDFLSKGDSVAAAAGLSGGALGGDGEDNGAAHAFGNTGVATWAVGALAVLFSAVF